jgi:chondroitin AC lyase
MKQKLFPIFVALLFLYSGANAQADAILSRYKQYLLKTIKPEGDVKQFMTSLNAGGQWPDINYQDTEKANWKNLVHLKRLRDLALVWESPGSTWFQNPQVWKTFSLGLNHWLDKRYKNPNWWHNEIGVPGYMRDIIILLRDKLTDPQLKAALEIMAQHRVQENAVGANLTWSADLGFHYGALTNNPKLMQLCRNLIIKEVRISIEEGVQPDFSFHQHGQRLQMYQYGRAFLWDNIRLAWELRGTSMAFPEEKIKILMDFALNGWQWMARGVHTVPGTMDRSASRLNALKSADLIDLLPYFIALSPENKTAFDKFSEIQKDKAALSGYRYYPYSDFTAYHDKDFSFFLKTISSRTLATESINSENLKGKLLNSGDTYLIRDGNEYFNLMPVWNWGCLPGVTAFNGADQIKRQQFTGAVSDGKVGLTVMDYQLENKDKSKLLIARKFWAVSGKRVICLIAGLQATGISDVYTTLDQCRWRSDVTVNQENNRIRAGAHELNNVSWIHHAGFAYIPINPAAITLTLATVTGSWKEINASETNAPVNEKIFMPVLHHGNLESGGYLLAACKTPKEAAEIAARREWQVIRNDKEIQAVQFNDGTLMAAFYQAGTLRAQKVVTQLKIDQPCLVLIRNQEIWLSNPAFSAITVTLDLNHKRQKIVLPADGSSVKAAI